MIRFHVNVPIFSDLHATFDVKTKSTWVRSQLILFTMKKYIILSLCISLLCISSERSLAGNPEDHKVLATILSIKEVQEFIIKGESPIYSNSLIDDDITIYMNEKEYQIVNKSSDSSKKDRLYIKKFFVKEDDAKVVIMRGKVKAKIYLRRLNDEWTVRHYFIVDPDKVAAEVNF